MSDARPQEPVVPTDEPSAVAWRLEIYFPAFWTLLGSMLAFGQLNEDPRDIFDQFSEWILWFLIGALGAGLCLLCYIGYSAGNWVQRHGSSMAEAWGVGFLGFVIGAGFVFVLTFAVDAAGEWLGISGIPSEGELVRQIAEDQLELDRVADLVCDEWRDGRLKTREYVSIQFDPEPLRPTTGPNLAIKRALFESGLEGVQIEGPESAVRLAVLSRGLSLGGSERGLYRTSTRPANVVDGLDQYLESRSRGEKYLVYRWVQGDWYVYYRAW